jgi:hypothetical protein
MQQGLLALVIFIGVVADVHAWHLTISGATTVRKRTVCLNTPLKRKEEFSLFKVSDEYKVKISPQLLLATQRFLSRGEGKGWSLPLLSVSA